MEEVVKIQREIFQKIKAQLSPNLSLVFEIANLLKLSHDSAYRRIRGENPLSLKELFTLKERFNISLDQFCGSGSNSINFGCSPIDAKKFELSDLLDKIYYDLREIYTAKDCEIIYAAKDPPLFHYFQLPEIAAFKIFFWEKTLFQFPEYNGKMFNLSDVPSETYQKGQKVLTLGTKIPTIEIWNEYTFRIMLSQIEYYWVSGFFANKDDLFNLLDKTEKWIHHIQTEAEYGFKFLYGGNPEGVENTFKLYSNEVVLNDNTILVKSNNKYNVYLTYNVLSVLQTSNQKFCAELDNYFKSIIKKSNLISLTGAKERNRFFNEQIFAIKQFKKRVV